jgi:hypothetical protein
MAGRFSYSFDRETFHGSYDTRQEAVNKALEKLNELSDSPEIIYVAKRVPIGTGASGLAETVLTAMRRRVSDEIGDSASQHLRRVNEHQLAELDDELNRVVSSWLAKYELAPSHFKTTAISEHPVPHPSMSHPGNDAPFS